MGKLAGRPNPKRLLFVLLIGNIVNRPCLIKKNSAISDVSRAFWEISVSAGGLGVAVTPPMSPGQSAGGGPGGKAPGSTWDLVI